MQEERYFTRPAVVHKYDTYIGDNIPFYWAAMGFIADALGELLGAERAFRCVELGSGSGNLCCTVSRRVRFAGLTLVDHSATFLEVAARKIAATPTVEVAPELRHASFLSPEWDADLPDGEFDLVLSSLTLDHIREDDDFLGLLARIHRLLAPGGLLVICEKCAHPDPATPSWQSFAAMIHIRGEHNLRHGLKTEDEVAEWKHHNFHEDVLRPMVSIWDLLDQAGFTVLRAGGARLPAPEAFNYDAFYRLTAIEPVVREHARPREDSYGASILIARRR